MAAAGFASMSASTRTTAFHDSSGAFDASTTGSAADVSFVVSRACSFIVSDASLCGSAVAVCMEERGTHARKGVATTVIEGAGLSG
jgi:hypothetical protein